MTVSATASFAPQGLRRPVPLTAVRNQLNPRCVRTGNLLGQGWLYSSGLHNFRFYECVRHTLCYTTPKLCRSVAVGPKDTESIRKGRERLK